MVSMFQGRRNEGEDRIDEIYSGLSFLVDVNDLINGYWLHGKTGEGRYFEIIGYPPNIVEVKIYENKESMNPTHRITMRVSGDESALRKIAEVLHDIIEKELGDRIEEITISS